MYVQTVAGKHTDIQETPELSIYFAIAILAVLWNLQGNIPCYLDKVHIQRIG